MIDHLTTYATDFAATREFYDEVLPMLGYQRNVDLVATFDPDWPERRLCAYGVGAKPTFWVAEVKAEDKATPRHLAFAAESDEAVRAFHAAGLAIGAPDHGAPGPRPQYHPGYYGAFLLDPDGNNVEAVFHGHAD